MNQDWKSQLDYEESIPDWRSELNYEESIAEDWESHVDDHDNQTCEPHQSASDDKQDPSSEINEPKTEESSTKRPSVSTSADEHKLPGYVNRSRINSSKKYKFIHRNRKQELGRFLPGPSGLPKELYRSEFDHSQNLTQGTTPWSFPTSYKSNVQWVGPSNDSPGLDGPENLKSGWVGSSCDDGLERPFDSHIAHKCPEPKSHLSDVNDRHWGPKNNLSDIDDRRWEPKNNLTDIDDRRWEPKNNLSNIDDRRWEPKNNLSDIDERCWKGENRALSVDEVNRRSDTQSFTTPFEEARSHIVNHQSSFEFARPAPRSKPRYTGRLPSRIASSERSRNEWNPRPSDNFTRRASHTNQSHNDEPENQTCEEEDRSHVENHQSSFEFARPAPRSKPSYTGRLPSRKASSERSRNEWNPRSSDNFTRRASTKQCHNDQCESQRFGANSELLCNQESFQYSNLLPFERGTPDHEFAGENVNRRPFEFQSQKQPKIAQNWKIMYKRKKLFPKRNPNNAQRHLLTGIESLAVNEQLTVQNNETPPSTSESEDQAKIVIKKEVDSDNTLWGDHVPQAPFECSRPAATNQNHDIQNNSSEWKPSINHGFSHPKPQNKRRTENLFSTSGQLNPDIQRKYLKFDTGHFSVNDQLSSQDSFYDNVSDEDDKNGCNEMNPFEIKEEPLDELKPTCSVEDTPVNDSVNYIQVEDQDEPVVNVTEVGFTPHLELAVQKHYSHLYEHQALMVTKAREGQNVLLSSEGLRGETEAFCLSILDKLDPNINEIQALYVYARNHSIDKVMSSLEKFNRELAANRQLRFMVITGGVSMKATLYRMRATKPQAIICTPGKLETMIRNKKINLSTVRLIILKQFSFICRYDALMRNLDQILKALPDNTQMLVSRLTKDANVNKKCNEFLKNYFKEGVEFAVTPQMDVKNTVSQVQFYYSLMPDSRNLYFELLSQLLTNFEYKKTLIYCSPMWMAQELVYSLKNYNFSVALLDESEDKKENNLRRNKGIRYWELAQRKYEQHDILVASKPRNGLVLPDLIVFDNQDICDLSKRRIFQSIVGKTKQKKQKPRLVAFLRTNHEAELYEQHAKKFGLKMQPL